MTRTYRRTTEEDTRYVSHREATRLLQIDPSRLRRMAREGIIRARKEQTSIRNGRRAWRYHIDDIQTMRWPRLCDVLRAGGHCRSAHNLVKHYNIPGVKFVNGRWRIHPDEVPRLLAWLRDGRPIRPPFLPK